MKDDFEILKWETPFCEARSVGLVSISDDGRLSVSLQAAHEQDIRLICVTFLHYPAYRIVSENIRFGKRKLRQQDKSDALGWTFTVPNSAWVEAANHNDSIKAKELTHYMICTEDQVIEVLSASAPTIMLLGRTSAQAPAAMQGASRLADGLTRTALRYLDNGKVTEAEELFKRLIRIRQRTQGSDHADLVRLLQGYVRLLKCTRREREAAKVERRVSRLITKMAAQINDDFKNSDAATAFSAERLYGH